MAAKMCPIRFPHKEENAKALYAAAANRYSCLCFTRTLVEVLAGSRYGIERCAE
ncbi:MAG: hypothetical protein WCI77_04415 [Candidatus Omnitrophota bacterium]